MIAVDSRNLEAEMKQRHISRKDLADYLHVSYGTVNTKINGTSPWLYRECVDIRDRFFPDKELSYLFPYAEETEGEVQ